MSFFGDIFKFEKSAMGDRLDLAKKDWWRVPLGVMDQGSTEIFNKVSGKNLEPMVDYFGGTTPQNVQNAQAAGINTGPGERMHDLARLVTSLYAGGYGAGKLGFNPMSAVPKKNQETQRQQDAYYRALLNRGYP